MGRKGRVRLDEQTLATLDDVEAVVGEIARQQISLNLIGDELDSELQAVRERYEGRIEGLKEDVRRKTKLLKTWAEANPERFASRKSIILLHGRLGFRTTTPRVSQAGLKVAETLAILRSAAPEYVRTKEELNKDAIIADWSQKLVAAEVLKGYGLKVTQNESFFVEPKLEDTAEGGER